MPTSAGLLKPASCHPSKPALTQSGPLAGLCGACYHRQRRSGGTAAAAREDAETAATLSAAIALLTPLVVDGQIDMARAIALTDAELTAALPEAARAMRRIIATDPAKGHSFKAADAVLRGFSVPSATGQRRILESPTKPVEGNAATQVVIGLHVSAPGDVKVGHVVGTLTPVQKKSPTE